MGLEEVNGVRAVEGVNMGLKWRQDPKGVYYQNVERKNI